VRPDARSRPRPTSPVRGVAAAADGSEERVISEPGPGNDNWINHFAWFSDIGGAIAESPPTWDPPSIYVVNADGTGLRWLADGEYPDFPTSACSTGGEASGAPA
jgi:hypothetical protein